MCEFCKAGLPHRETGTSRRNILKSAMAGVTAAALFPTLLNRSAEASELPKGCGHFRSAYTCKRRLYSFSRPFRWRFYRGRASRGAENP